MWEAEIIVTLKEGVLDPQGKAIQGGLKALGLTGVQEVRVGKFIRVRLEAENEEAARRDAETMCSRLLANPVIEQYRYQVREVAP